MKDLLITIYGGGDDAVEAAKRLSSLTLTSDERRDIRIAANAYGECNDDAECERIEATLRGLLARCDAYSEDVHE